jgi:glycyl-tRNA synthetase beta chain
MNKFIFEIGTEEIPSQYIDNMLKSLKSNAKNILNQLRIDYSNISTFGTPRRLILYVEGIASWQKDTFHKTKGPSIGIAFDSVGNPLNSAIKFAQANNLEVKDLIIEQTDKGKYVFAKNTIKGEKSEALLPEICENLITNIDLPKSMKWGVEPTKFIRPIRWLLSLYNDKCIRVKFNSLISDRITYGNRLLAPEAIKIKCVEDYFEALKERFVIIDPEIRKEIIQKQIISFLKKTNAEDCIDYSLLDEVKNLVEYPKVLIGHFDSTYLTLPADVLKAVMVKHQKYFPVYQDRNNLLPLFLVVINGNEDQYSKSILWGNERVLKARLEDANFFFQEDQKIVKQDIKPLDYNIEKLKNVVFQEGLGSVYDKTMRLVTLSTKIADELKIDKNSRKILERSANLSKTDLVSEMVKEFPELQGIMGKEYALLQGEDPEVAKTIFEHYLPRHSGDDLPTSITGSILSMADKIDNITSCFINDLAPDGSQDPYALRRQSLGIINIVLHHKLDLSLDKIIGFNVNILLTNKNEQELDIVRDNFFVHTVKNFIFQRLRYLLLEKEFKYDIIDAVLAKNPESIIDILSRVETIQKIYFTEDFMKSITAANRAFNLSKNIHKFEIKPILFLESEETVLYNNFIETKKNIDELILRHDYLGIYSLLNNLNKPIDIFFDKILVMVDDEGVRNNRLALLKNIANLYSTVADLNKIAFTKVNHIK